MKRPKRCADCRKKAGNLIRLVKGDVDGFGFYTTVEEKYVCHECVRKYESE